MKEINKKFGLYMLNIGLILGGILIFAQLMIYIFDIDTFNMVFSFIYQLLTIVLFTWIMAWACIKFRDKYLEGKIKFLRCFLGGLIIGITATLIISIYTYVFYKFFDPDKLQIIAEKSRDMIDSYESIPEEKKAEIIKNMMDRFNPESMLVQTLIMMSSMSVFLSLIATLFVRKKEKVTETIY
jgi:hypothetical protein